MADNGISKACANISLSISNPADTQAVFVRAPVLATPADEPPLVGQIVLVELNEDPDALKVQLGSKLTIDQCDDVIETGNTAVVDEEFLPISGTVRVEVTEIIEAGGPYPLYKANVSLQAVRFAADEAGVTLDLGTYSFGFLPG